nr:Hint domain-containing protein [Paracoccus saliphilus]
MTDVTWLWFGNQLQANMDPTTPASTAEAEHLVGYGATGPNQIAAVTVSGTTRTITVNGTSTQAFATTYNNNPYGPSPMSFVRPTDDMNVGSQITGLFSANYRVTMGDGTQVERTGALIQMSSGDIFLRPTAQNVAEWEDITTLRSVKILSVTPGDANTYAATVSFSPQIMDVEIVCFAAGTLIRTISGDRPVETLSAGDLIWTRDNGYQPLRWCGSSHLDGVDLAAAPRLRPVRIEAGALGAGIPRSTLTVSPQHRILVRSVIAQRMFGTRELLAPAKQLLALEGVEVDDRCQSVTYHHLLFNRHEILIANGTEAESLYPGVQALHALDKTALQEIQALFPALMKTKAAPPSARPFGKGAKLRRLVIRHAASGQPLVA